VLRHHPTNLSRPDRGQAGAFYRPALLEAEDVNTDIVQKEVFGPVATFEAFDIETDALARANATEFGLAAGIFTSSINISRRVSREIQAGMLLAESISAGGRGAGACVRGYRREVSSATMSAADCDFLASATLCPAHIESASISPVVPAIGGAGS
jgi:acyl-CoA reductase-like NAD-dependent aldehyde dehydrogenase